MPKNLISIQDFSKEEMLHILDVAREFEDNREQNFLSGKVIACLFFEPSTRTRLSFEAAVNRLGARVIGFPDNRNTSQTKGETLEDTIRIVSNYVDMIVMRHPMAGAADIAASVAKVPVINAGDGANQHPTQTLPATSTPSARPRAIWKGSTSTWSETSSTAVPYTPWLKP